MGAAMAEPDDDDFLSRWSRRKQGEHPEQVPDEPSGEDSPEEDEGDPEVVAQLPDIAGMDDTSDFSVFLKAGVPEVLRRQALRKLWRVNPVLANLDGLNDYDGDYTQMGALGEGLKTLYKIGKGFVTDETDAVVEDVPAKDAPDEPEPQPSELPAPDESEPQSISERAPEKVARNPKGVASNRRWGTPETPS